MTVIDFFAGPGGWSEGLRSLGMADFGIEWDDAACATRYAAGHATWQADVSQVDPAVFASADVQGVIASPPCPDFSLAGKRAGVEGESGRLIWEPMRFIRRVWSTRHETRQHRGALPARAARGAEGDRRRAAGVRQLAGDQVLRGGA